MAARRRRRDHPVSPAPTSLQDFPPALQPRLVEAVRTDQPLLALQEVLRQAGADRPVPELHALAWTVLGLPGPAPEPGKATSYAALAGLAELHDVGRSADVAALARLLSREEELVPDLRAARPWLPPGRPEELLEAVFSSEWSGFLGRLGASGAWVYAASVAELQQLGHRYGQLVEAFLNSRASEVLLALAGADRPLLLRLERASPRPLTPLETRAAQVQMLSRAEATFWDAARQQAMTQRDAWASRQR
ncbi:hypothetical protein [Deinococcus sonorensis]|uniref:Uncharacterized protein n=2 Tax=Deinococcus sonorensis TaxID=309891 RepID=A0AAU7U9Q5_9DEIO